MMFDVTPNSLKVFIECVKDARPAKHLELVESRAGSVVSERDLGVGSVASESVLEKALGSVELTLEQRRVLDEVSGGTSGIFFTGSAGTGKSFVLQTLKKVLNPAVTAFTATTGVAAVALGGTTVQSWSGLSQSILEMIEGLSPPTPRELAAFMVKELSRKKDAVARWRKTNTLVVDEVSMMSAPLMDALELCGRVVRNNKGVAFGGLQVVLAGDFFQLPPVFRGGTGGTAGGGRFAFQARCWPSVIKSSISLSRVFRQGEDSEFISLLNEARRGRVSPEHAKLLERRWCAKLELPPGVLPTKLATHRTDVDSENLSALEKLPGKMHEFHAEDTFRGPSTMAKALSANCPAPPLLGLKVGTQVILTKTLDPARGLVNGARGAVKHFLGERDGGWPVVVFSKAGTSVETVVSPTVWEVSLSGGGGWACRKALPLALAWSLSIHKSQGLTLDAVEMSLSRVFECGQAYVALSRAVSLSKFSLSELFNPSCIRAHPDVVAFMDVLEKGSKKLDSRSSVDGTLSAAIRKDAPSPHHNHKTSQRTSPIKGFAAHILKASLLHPNKIPPPPPPPQGSPRLPAKASFTAFLSPKKQSLQPPSLSPHTSIQKQRGGGLTLKSFFNPRPLPLRDPVPKSPNLSPPMKMSRMSS